MFVDFDEIFDDNPKSQFKIPKQYLEFLNKRLPEGIKYVADENGNCRITFEGTEMKIGGFKPIPNAKQKKILGNNYSLNNLLDYAYNSQQKIQVDLVEAGYITLNDQRFPINKLEQNPFKPIEIVDGSFYLIPPRFEGNIPIKLSDKKYERVVSVSRVPNDSLDIISFTSKEDEPLRINYKYNKTSKDMKINMSFDLKYAKTIRDVVESIYIYNAFLDGRGYLQGEQLKMNLDSKDYKKFDEKSALFWEKVLMIETELNVKFVPPQENVEYDKILEIEEMYQSLIEKKPFRDKNIITSINAKWELKDKEDIESHIDKTLFFQFNATYSADIFNCKINLPALIMIFNSKLLKVENGNNIILGDDSVDNKRYTSIMCFKNNEELEKYKKEPESKRIQLFKDAKRAHEYLNNK